MVSAHLSTRVGSNRSLFDSSKEHYTFDENHEENTAEIGVRRVEAPDGSGIRIEPVLPDDRPQKDATDRNGCNGEYRSEIGDSSK